MSETALAAASVNGNTSETRNDKILVQYGCSICGKIYFSEELCDEHIVKCAQNKLATQDHGEEARSKSDTSKRKLDPSIDKSDSASIFDDSDSDISDNEQESKKDKICKIELNEEQKYVALESTVYEATSQMLSENEMLITLPYDQINDATGGPLDFSNEVAIAFEQHAQEIIDFAENLKPDTCNEKQEKGTVTIENYDVEDFCTVDRDSTIEILSVFTSKSSQDCPSESGENGDSQQYGIGADNVVEEIEIADNENNKVLTDLKTVDVIQIEDDDHDEVTVIDILKHTESGTSDGSFVVEREVQSESKDNGNLKKMKFENEPLVNKRIVGDNENGVDPPNSQERDPKQQPDEAETDELFLLYKTIPGEFHKVAQPKKRGRKPNNRSSISKKPQKKRKNLKNVHTQLDLEKYKEFLEEHAKYRRENQRKQISKNLQKNRQSPDEDFPEVFYSQIVCKEEEKDLEEEPNELSVYEFYDEEEEKLKAQRQKNLEIEKEIKKRTCKFCNTIFNDPMEVLRHKRESHKFKRVIMSRSEIEPYLIAKNRTECPLCFMKLGEKVSNAAYVKHVMTHCDEYSFQCRVCHLQFRRKDHWTLHEARHVVAPEVTD